MKTGRVKIIWPAVEVVIDLRNAGLSDPDRVPETLGLWRQMLERVRF